MKNKIHICFWKTDRALTAKVLDLTLDAKNKAMSQIAKHVHGTFLNCLWEF